MARATDTAYDKLRAGIISGQFVGGERLREDHLAGVFGVSRTPVREALRRLEAEGLVDFQPNRGAVVVEWTDADLEEMYGLRALLEGHAARRAAERITDEEITQLAAATDAMEAAASKGKHSQLAEHNQLFHEIILGAAGSKRLAETLAGLVEMPLVQRTFHRYSPAGMARSIAHHRELIEAFRAHDPSWAEAVMRSHVLAARRQLTS